VLWFALCLLVCAVMLFVGFWCFDCLDDVLWLCLCIVYMVNSVAYLEFVCMVSFCWLVWVLVLVWFRWRLWVLMLEFCCLLFLGFRFVGVYGVCGCGGFGFCWWLCECLFVVLGLVLLFWFCCWLFLGVACLVGCTWWYYSVVSCTCLFCLVCCLFSLV